MVIFFCSANTRHGCLRHGIGLEFLIQLLHIVGQLRAVQRFHQRQIGVHHALRVKHLKCVRILSSGGGHDRHVAFHRHRCGNIRHRNFVDIDHEDASVGQRLRAVGDPDNAILYLHLSPGRYFNHIGLESIGAVVGLGHDSPLKNLLCVRHHGLRLGGGHSLLRQEFSVHQHKPATVHRYLNVILVGNVRGVGIGICTAIQLEAKAVVQRVRRELTGSRLVRLKGQTGLQIDHAELHRHHQVAVVSSGAVDVRVVIIGIVVLLHGHVEGGHKHLHPCNAGHRAAFARKQRDIIFAVRRCFLRIAFLRLLRFLRGFRLLRFLRFAGFTRLIGFFRFLRCFRFL